MQLVEYDLCGVDLPQERQLIKEIISFKIIFIQLLNLPGYQRLVLSEKQNQNDYR